jgi:hypothetical protein
MKLKTQTQTKSQELAIELAAIQKFPRAYLLRLTAQTLKWAFVAFLSTHGPTLLSWLCLGK